MNNNHPLQDNPTTGMGFDKGIETFVTALREEGLDTAEPYKAGKAASISEPTVRFQGGMAALFKAFSIAQARGLPVLDVRVAYYSVGSQLGSWWEMTFAAQPSYNGPSYGSV
ncbi:MAG TPA: hypothetical protein VIE17_10920 [Methylophilaceae bacterium]